MSSVKVPSVIIKGLGSYAPERVLTNDDLSKIVETSDDWIRTRTGIRERRLAADSQFTSDLAVEAARNAIADAGLTPADIDLIIVATITPDMPFPSTACLVQTKLGMRKVPAFDIEAACSGFLYAMEVATSMVRHGSARHALVIGAEKLSSITNWKDRTTCVLFGDGAGAVVLTADDRPGIGILGSSLGADGSQTEILYMPAGGSARPPSHETVDGGLHFLAMQGKEVFKIAVRAMEQSAQGLLAANGLTGADVACVVPHQANIRIIEALSQRLGVGMDRVQVNVDRYGNTSAASIPLALDEAYREGRFKAGDNLVLVAFGAGLTWASTLIKWQR